MLIILFVILSLLSLVYLLVHRKHKPPLRPPPGPKGLPFIGNFHQYNFASPLDYFVKLGKVYGPIFSLTLGHVPVVVVQSAELAKEVLKTQDINFCSRPSLVGMHKLSYNGLDIAFAPYGEYYREVRKLSVVHLFSSKRVDSFGPIRREEVSRLIKKISLLSSDKYEDDDGSRSRFHGLLNEVQALLVGFFYADYFPFSGWLDKLKGQTSRLENVFKQMDAFYEQMINDHLDPNRPKGDQEDIIDLLLKLKTQQRSFAFELTWDHIKAILMIIFVAGTDTSTATVVWAMTGLIKNPDSLKRVQEELRNVAQNKGYIDEGDLPKLEYFKAVIKETFRLHPAVPLLVVRETVRKATLDGYDIQPKTLVHVNVWAIGRDPELWKDPEKFMPERFIGSSIDFRGQDFELIPFGAGRRICPGLGLGVANLELTLANFLYSFDWELPSGLKMEDIDTEGIPGVTMHKKNPLCLVAKKFVPEQV